MLLLKVILALSVYQYYCVGIYIYPQDGHDYHSIHSDKLGGTETPMLSIEKDFTKPDEIETTDDELTTKHDETTTESNVCPPDKSLYSKKDISAIIDFVFDELNLNESMIEHVVPQAKDINQKLSKDLNQFEGWFQNQPEHLLHVLEGLSSVRKQKIEPEAQKIAVILKDYQQLEANIDEKKAYFNKLSKKLNKYENLCKYTCEDQDLELNHLFKRSVPDEYVCSSIVDLHKQIKGELTENYEAFLKKLKENLLTTNKTYTEKIESIKNDLKDSALVEFGRTMYDVLKLEDDYHHYVKEINSTDTQNLFYAVKNAGLQIDSKLLELQRLIEDYGNYCRNFKNGPVKRSVRQTQLQANVNEKSKAIVHDLILKKYNESELQVNEVIEETFAELNASIYDPNKKQTFLNILKLKQKEIVGAENSERQSLEQLKNIASPDSITKLSDLDSISKDLLKNIDEKIAYVKKIVH